MILLLTFVFSCLILLYFYFLRRNLVKSREQSLEIYTICHHICNRIGKINGNVMKYNYNQAMHAALILHKKYKSGEIEWREIHDEINKMESL